MRFYGNGARSTYMGRKNNAKCIKIHKTNILYTYYVYTRRVLANYIFTTFQRVAYPRYCVRPFSYIYTLRCNPRSCVRVCVRCARTLASVWCVVVDDCCRCRLRVPLLLLLLFIFLVPLGRLRLHRRHTRVYHHTVFPGHQSCRCYTILLLCCTGRVLFVQETTSDSQ